MISGRCLCNAVTFTVDAVENDYHVCHCGMCRRWSGGPVMVADAQGVVFTGNESLARYDSSEWAQRGFCKSCGSNLFYYLKPADRYLMTVGAFDDAERFRMVGEIFVDHQPPGYQFAGNLGRETEAEFLAKFA